MSKTTDGFNELRNQVKEKKEKSKSINKKNKSDVNDNVDGDGNVNGNGDGNGDSKKPITISKEENSQKKIKRTYYIYEENDEKISKLSRRSGKDKSELVRIAIDFLYDNVEIK